jgi:thiol-disulfide isomerase/thioredoxin
VEDFALYDIDNNVWQLSRERRGKLILLDFWFTRCPPCRAALPFMVEMDRKYRRHGLQVVGIANEAGTFPEKQAAVRQARTQYGITYPLLFAGGGTGDCPVLHQLEVMSYPTMILLDESGRIVQRFQGMDQRTKRDLEMTIYRHLVLPPRQGTP